jgi:hypothetical protein
VRLDRLLQMATSRAMPSLNRPATYSSTDRNSPWQAASYSDRKEIPRILYNLLIHHSFHNSSTTVLILSHITPDHTLPYYFTPVHTLPYYITLIHTLPDYFTLVHTLPYYFTPVHTLTITLLRSTPYPITLLRSTPYLLLYSGPHLTQLL